MTKNHNSEPDNQYSFYLTIFIIGHIFLWTILPTLLRHNLPLDTLEAIGWGREWQLGYYKHPPLSAWISEINALIFNRTAWTFYLLSQISVAISLIAIWHTAKLFLTTRQSFMATLLCEAIYYYNITSTEFNPNVLLISLWAIMIFNCYKAFFDNRLLNWILFAVFAGLSISTKYHTVFILVSMIFTFFYQPKFRQSLKTINPYIAIVLFAAVITPHLLWVLSNDFASIKYGLERCQNDNYHFYNHFNFAFGFTLSQIISFAGAMMIFFTVFQHAINAKKFDLQKDDKLSFLFFVGFGPLILTTAYSAITAAKLKDMWGTEFWNLLTIFLFYFWQPNLTLKNSKKFYWGVAIVTFIYAAIYVGVFFTYSKRADFGGKFAADSITNKWHETYQQPLEIISGDIWLVGNVAFYSKDRPHIFIDMMPSRSPWVSFTDLKKKGGVVVWSVAENGSHLPPYFKAQCNKATEIKSDECNKMLNEAIEQPPLLIPWNGIKNHQEPYHLGWAIIKSSEQIALRN